MKKLIITAITTIVLLFGATQCRQKTETATANPLRALTEKYVTEEMEISPLDSVVVVKVDTVDAWEYASIMVSLLQQMDGETLSAYQAALQADDTQAIRDLDLQLEEIAAAGQQWEQEVAALEGAPKNTCYYLITANYFAGSNIDQFYFFVTPDMQIHIPDPFDEL